MQNIFRSWRLRLRDKAFLRTVRFNRVGWEARRTGHMDWTTAIKSDPERWRQAVANAKGPKVLLATQVGLHFGANRLDSLLAVALTLRGARVEHLFCDQALPACMTAELSWYPDLERFGKRGLKDDLCQHCFKPAVAALEPLGLPLHRVGDYLTDDDRAEVSEWAAAVHLDQLKFLKVDGINIGEQALSGALRFFARGTLESGSEPVVRAYLRAARLVQLSAKRVMEKNKPDVTVLHHGIYVPQGTTAAVAHQAGVRVVTWNPAYRKRCFIFSHKDTYHRSMMSEPVADWETLSLSKTQEDMLSRYLESRRDGKEDWISFSRKPAFDFEAFAAERGIDMGKPIIAMLTNVFWDAQLHYPANGFASMREWMVGTIRHFAKRPEIQLLIRVHPAEITGNLPARETVPSILAEEFDDLPPNVFVVAADEPISTYALAAQCRAAIIYATKAGIELLSMGIPVIAAGEAWVRGKDMALESDTEDGYYRILDKLPDTDLDIVAAQKRARLYAYHFFFRRMIPLSVAEPIPGWPPYRLNVDDLDKIAPGRDKGLDVVCDGILAGKPFTYPAEDLMV